jgi:hypothetical protein
MVALPMMPGLVALPCREGKYHTCDTAPREPEARTAGLMRLPVAAGGSCSTPLHQRTKHPHSLTIGLKGTYPEIPSSPLRWMIGQYLQL